MVEMSFSYNTTSKEPRTHFQYEIIGTDGVIRYNREEHSFELRNSHGTQHLPWHPEKSFTGMYVELLKALQNETPGNMPTADDGIKATKIAKAATDQAIRERDKPSIGCPSTKERASMGRLYGGDVPMDFVD
jgi:predicted dehydrogenase